MTVNPTATGTRNAAAALPRGILILGAAKSGTTALFYAIQNTLIKRHGLNAKGLFEPIEAEKVQAYLDSAVDPVPLIKVLLGPFIRKEMKLFDAFEKKVIIYRDPRDNVISRLVFMLTRLIEPGQNDKIEAVLELLRGKERAPESISVAEIIRQVGRITGREGLLASVRNNALLPAKMKRQDGDRYFMMSYEDFVESRFDALNRYLGFEVDPEFEVGGKHTHIVRTKSSGNWRDWFLQEDVDYFVKEVADDYALLGFDATQQPLADKTLDPKIGSEYALAQFTRLGDKRPGHRGDARKKKTPEVKAASAPSPADQADRRAQRKAAKQAAAAAPVSPDNVAAATSNEDEAARAARKAQRERRNAKRAGGEKRAKKKAQKP
ncbi:hypothetical protein [Hydrocarboniphaga sp.]|uniref:hypothetical protein n=1 Tax=Hydrocarboniphaga sp. TaxID=2033016 RepID=UPI003D14A699